MTSTLAEDLLENLDTTLPTHQVLRMVHQGLAHQLWREEIPGAFAAQAHEGDVAMFALQPGGEAEVIGAHRAQQRQAPPTGFWTWSLKQVGGGSGNREERCSPPGCA